MKRILLVTAAAFFGLLAHADDNVLQIVDAAGNDVSNTTVYANVKTTTDVFGVEQSAADPELTVKNLSDGLIQCKIAYTIKEITSGYHSLCFSTQCEDKRKIGVYNYEYPKPMKAGAQSLLHAKWYPEGGQTDGKCTVVYKTAVYTATDLGGGKVEYTFVSDGPSVTVCYLQDMTGIETTLNNSREVSAVYYDMSGRLVETPAKGLFVKRTVYSNGTVMNTKVYIK